MAITIAPTTAEDVSEFLPDGLPWRVKAWSCKSDGRVIGIGGVTYIPDGTAIVFLEASEADCKSHPLTLHRTATRFLKELRAENPKRKVLAIVDPDREAAPRWLERLGFEYVYEIDGKAIYQWQQ